MTSMTDPMPPMIENALMISGTRMAIIALADRINTVSRKCSQVLVSRFI